MNKHYFLSFFVLLFVLTSCKKEVINNEPIRLFGNVFGTSYNIIYYDSKENFETEIAQLFTEVNKSTSTYIPTSLISRINRGEEGIVVDKLFKEVFSKSKRIFKETDGYFDPTVGNLVNAWGFGPGKPLKNLDTLKVNELMNYVGFEKVNIIEGKIEKMYPQIHLDFNSIGKGYGVDVVARFLESKGIKNYLVEIGGEIRTRGFKPEGKPWNIQLENPNTDGTRSAYTYLKLTNKSMASSGNYRKFRITENGEKYVHTINPKTGYATESNLLAASVIAELDCADVDAYATAFMAMGMEKTKEFLQTKPELKVILIYANEEGGLEEYRN